MTLRVRNLQIDVPGPDFERTLAFWAGALSATPQAVDGTYTHLVAATAAVAVHVQRLGGGEARYHLDLGADHLDAEADRLVELGATRNRWQPSSGEWLVLEGPAGLPLCVVPDTPDLTPLAPRRADTGYLDGVFVDVPAGAVQTAVAFWSAALGATVEPSSGAYTPLGGVEGPGGRLFFEVQQVGAPARHHVDLVAGDVEREAARLESLGARRVAEIDTWITLADPAGNLLCVVPEASR